MLSSPWLDDAAAKSAFPAVSRKPTAMSPGQCVRRPVSRIRRASANDHTSVTDVQRKRNAGHNQSCAEAACIGT
jgi:hypothetical protein